MCCITFIRSYICLLTIFFVKCLIVAELQVISIRGTDTKAAKVEWTPLTQAEYYLVNITALSDVIFDDLVYVGKETSLEIHYNTLVTKTAEKNPEKIEVCPVVSAFGNGTVIARTSITCLSKFNNHYIRQVRYYSSWLMYDGARLSMKPNSKTKELITVQ